MKHFFILPLFFSFLSLGAQDLLFRLIPATSTGAELTYDLIVDNFTDIAAMQYSIAYDTSVLRFISIEDIIVPGMSESNFQTDIPGVILNAWFESSTSGVTLDNGTVIYRLVFERKTHGEPQVCFSQEPLETEILQGENDVIDLYVMDDCHTTPFLFDEGTTGIANVVATLGMQINNMARSGKINFNLNDPLSLSMNLMDMSGKLIANFPDKTYTAGQHNLQIESKIIPGVYLLVVGHQNQKAATQILFIE